MNNEVIIKEAVAAGLRAMKKPPAVLLYIDGVEDGTYDEPVICGLFVYHSCSLSCARWGTHVHDCPFIPVWCNESDSHYSDRARFAEAYCDTIARTAQND